MGEPVMMNFKGKNVLIVGGGQTAFRKAKRLKRDGAFVTIIALQILKPFDQLACEVTNRGYRGTDLLGYQFVIAATDNSELNLEICEDCNRLGILCSSVSANPFTDFNFMACEKRGPLTVAVSTGGASPGFGKQLVGRALDAIEGEEADIYEKLEALGQLRAILLVSEPDGAKRKEILTEALHMDVAAILSCMENIKTSNRDNIKQI